MNTNPSLRALLSLSWQSVAYGIGIFGSQAIMLVMTPLFTHNMAQQEYGAISVITVIYAFINTFTNAGLPSATFRLFNDSSDEQNQRQVIGASQFLFFTFAFIPAIFILVFARDLSQILLKTDRFALSLQIAAVYLIFDTMNTFGTIMLRIQVRPLASSIHSVIMIACKTGIAVLMVMYWDMGVNGYWLGYLLGSFIGLLVMIWLIRSSLIFQVSLEKVIESLKYGIPLIPNALSNTALRLADRYLIGFFVGLEQVAIYDIGYKIGSIINMATEPFRSAWPQYAFSIMHKPNAQKIYRDVLSFLSAAVFLLILIIVGFRSEFVNLLAPASYDGAIYIIPWVALSQLFLALYPVLSIGPKILKKTHYLAWASVASAVVNIVLNLFLIPSMGILGAAIATFVSYLFLGVFTYIIGQRVFPFPIDWNRQIRILLMFLVTIALFTAGEKFCSGYGVELAVKGAGLLFFLVMLVVLNVIRVEQIKEIIMTVKNLINKSSYDKA